MITLRPDWISRASQPVGSQVPCDRGRLGTAGPTSNAFRCVCFGFVGLALLLRASLVRAATPGDALRAELAAAVPGATINVPAGDYDGPFIITTPVHLRGAPGAVLRGDKQTHVVDVRAPDVEIAGFIIRDSGLELIDDDAGVHISAPRAWIHDNRIVDTLHGIYVKKADNCRLEHNIIVGSGAAGTVPDPVLNGQRPDGAELCSVNLAQDRRGNGIHLWNSAGHLIIGNTIVGMRDGVYFSFTEKTVVRDNTLRRLRYGLHYMYSDENTFERNTFTDNAAGAALMFSRGLTLRDNHFVANRSQRAYGLLLQSIDDSRIENNEISGNTLGLYMEGGNHCVITGNRVTRNYVGVRVTDSCVGNEFFGNTFAGNLHAVETSGANTANTWAVAGRGNYWDDELRLDLDHNGVADLPHREADLFGAWRRTFPVIGLLSGSPGEHLLRFIHARIAMPGIPGVTDPAPLLDPPQPNP